MSNDLYDSLDADWEDLGEVAAPGSVEELYEERLHEPAPSAAAATPALKRFGIAMGVVSAPVADVHAERKEVDDRPFTPQPEDPDVRAWLEIAEESLTKAGRRDSGYSDNAAPCAQSGAAK